MATMVKEKRPKKKKIKEILLPESSSSLVDLPSIPDPILDEEDKKIEEIVTRSSLKPDIPELSTDTIMPSNPSVVSKPVIVAQSLVDNELDKAGIIVSNVATFEDQTEVLNPKVIEQDGYKSLNEKLNRMTIPEQTYQIDDTRISQLENSDAYLIQNLPIQSTELTADDVVPSAPIFDEESTQEIEEIVYYEKPKLVCMPLEEAIRLYGGSEIAAVKEMSVREQAEVETGPHCGPEHPLVDLLSTLRSSLRAVERERTRLASNFDEEEKYRSTLWKIEKKSIHMKQPCHCGLEVDMKASYEHAELLKERLPVAKMKLEGLLRDVQESYCHHKHAALLAHCQIEELISETIQSNKPEIRNALSLVLQALRVCDGVSEALPAALQRWAEMLAAALVDQRDMGQLLFLLHHLFRQTRSVCWAARALEPRVSDGVGAARTVAVLDILLSHLHADVAVECNEESEAWEEVDIKGGEGAVSSGTLRERDLVALLQAFPLQQLVARILLFSQANFKEATAQSWGDTTGGNGVLKACCGVRVLISVVQRATLAHPLYRRLHQILRDLARSALTGLASLYASNRAPYSPELEVKIVAEMEAAFAAGFTLFGSEELHTLPATLLTEHAARDYCLNFIVSLHDTSPKPISLLSVCAPALPCGARVRVAAHAAATRTQDNDLARIVLDFLLQTGLQHKSSSCKGGCAQTARECVSLLLAAHPYLHGIALHTVAEMSQVESLTPSVVSVLDVDKWRPSVPELQAVLQDWEQRCPLLLHRLLMQLDYTPHVGLPLLQQLHIGSFLLQHSRGDPVRLEASWRVLMQLRIHRALWGLAEDPGPPEMEPSDLFSMAHAVLATDWGHSIPLICTVGVSALCTLSGQRPREATHCLAPVMMMMAVAPDSISLTPKFAEMLSVLVSCGPSLVQRALGRGPASGAQLLQRLVLAQVTDKQLSGIFPAWLHALIPVPAALPALDVAALAARGRDLDEHANLIVQHDSKASKYISDAVQYAATAPLVCESLLRAAHQREVSSGLYPALLAVLHKQRKDGKRIHVDNALTSLKAGKAAEELTIYKTASAALVAPFAHPSHLTLWRLFFVMYLEKPPGCDYSTPACGPLFFSGLIKTRVLSQLKKRLDEGITYHQNESESYRATNESIPNNRVTESITSEDALLPALTIADLTGESIEEDKMDSLTDGSTEEAMEVEKRRNSNMAAYHVGAERLLRQYSHWLEEGEKVKDGPLYAEISRFITAQVMEEAWQRSLSRGRPPPSPSLDAFPLPAPPPPPACPAPLSPRDVAVAAIQSIVCCSGPRRTIKPRNIIFDKAVLGDTRVLDKLLKDIEKYAQEWSTEVSRVSSLDLRLWELVGVLRVPRPLPPVRRACANRCKPLTFHLDTHEWCISAGAERGIAESRCASLAGVRRLTRARPHFALTVATLHSLARCCRGGPRAAMALSAAWRAAGRLAACRVAHEAMETFYQILADRWIIHDGKLCEQLISNAKKTCTLQQALVGTLISPQRLPPSDWHPVYIALLQADLPPHTVFSYISRFEMHRWSDTASARLRYTVTQVLLSAVERFGPDPAASVLIEILGVHLSAIARCQESVHLLLACSQLAQKGCLPLTIWTHVNKALETYVHQLSLDDIANLLRSMGQVWSCVCVEAAAHAPHVCAALCAAARAVANNALKLTYAPDRVGGVVWSVLIPAWAPWLSPAGLLRPPGASQGDAAPYTQMSQTFAECVLTLMNDCPGSEARLLRGIISWSIETYEHIASLGDPDMRARLTVLLEELARLPWERHQWIDADCIGRVYGRIWVYSSDERHYDAAIRRWSIDRLTGTRAEALLAGTEAFSREQLAIHLANLLRLFTGNEYVTDRELLLEAARLPWSELPNEYLADGMSAFFAAHGAAEYYHETPQAIVIMSASKLCPCEWTPESSSKREVALIQWTSALWAPARRPQRSSFTRHLLRLITQLEPYLKKPEEVQKLLLSLTCVSALETGEEPSTLDTVKVWEQWISSEVPPSMLPACVSMTSQLLSATLAAPLALEALRTYLHSAEGSWSGIRALWRSAVLSPAAFAARGALLPAYAALIANEAPDTRELLKTLLVLTEGGFDFIKNEVMIAVFICFAARVVGECDRAAVDTALETSSSAQGGAAQSETEHCKRAALSLLLAWGAAQRRSLLKVVTLQADTDRPTPRHRVLVRYAELVLCPSAAAASSFESARAGAPRCDASWARAPAPPRLPALAHTLYIEHDKYFQWEIQQVRQ